MDLARYIKKLGNIKYECGVPLSSLCTFKIGGPADIVVKPSTRDELVLSVSEAIKCNIPYLVIGNGSNLLFDDDGFSGAVIVTNGMRALSFDGNTVTADAGVPMTALALRAQGAELSGLEFAYGIPGCVGGAVTMNAGAYGGQMSDVLVSSEYYDPASGERITLDAGEHNYGYRESIYIDRPDLVVLGAVLELTSSSEEDAKRKCDENMAGRKEKQPLEYPSAGSVFKRPHGYFAAKLIQDAELKGVRVGDAEVSEKHSGFIINRGKATSRDVLELVEIIKTIVYEKFGVRLECEIRYIPKEL